MSRIKILVEGDVAALIPQKAPIVMVDTLYEHRPDQVTTGLTVRSDHMFCENGLLREPGILEHIAQSAALKAGYEQHINNTPPSIGYIGSIKNFTLHSLPSVGDQLVTTVTVRHIVGDILILHGKVECEGREVAVCEMKVVEQKTP
ncbi:MAG: hydroxymyristoyl-ACP dehydratase [Bacteroidales bacterium]|jgi:predicted hotdog family 3-hydroxylacyl-ACP dehydratase|nr:hydroxymyristoyl-ACP dehydratase [Bacteroidales bacterium]